MLVAPRFDLSSVPAPSFFFLPPRTTSSPFFRLVLCFGADERRHFHDLLSRLFDTCGKHFPPRSTHAPARQDVASLWRTSRCASFIRSSGPGTLLRYVLGTSYFVPKPRVCLHAPSLPWLSPPHPERRAFRSRQRVVEQASIQAKHLYFTPEFHRAGS